MTAAFAASMCALATDVEIWRRTNPAGVQEALMTLRRQMASLEGADLMLARVAEAFMRVLVPTSPAAPLVRTMLADSGGRALLRRLLDGPTSCVDLGADAMTAVSELVTMGVFERHADQLSLRTTEKVWVSTLVLPPTIDGWRRVERARRCADGDPRKFAFYASVDIDEAVRFMVDDGGDEAALTALAKSSDLRWVDTLCFDCILGHDPLTGSRPTR